MSANNLSGSAQKINILDFEVTVDDYVRRINTYDIVNQVSEASQGVVDGSPLNGEVKAASTVIGCLAVRVPSDWKTIVVKYKGDITLESTAFEVNRDNPNIKWCTVAQTITPNAPSVPATKPTNQTESTTVPATTLPVTTTAPVTTSPFSTLPNPNN